MKPVKDLKAITVQWTADDGNTEGCKDLAEYTHTRGAFFVGEGGTGKPGSDSQLFTADDLVPLPPGKEVTLDKYPRKKATIRGTNEQKDKYLLDVFTKYGSNGEDTLLGSVTFKGNLANGKNITIFQSGKDKPTNMIDIMVNVDLNVSLEQLNFISLTWLPVGRKEEDIEDLYTSTLTLTSKDEKTQVYFFPLDFYTLLPPGKEVVYYRAKTKNDK